MLLKHVLFDSLVHFVFIARQVFQKIVSLFSGLSHAGVGTLEGYFSSRSLMETTKT